MVAQEATCADFECLKADHARWSIGRHLARCAAINGNIQRIGMWYAPAMATQVQAPVRPTLPDRQNVGPRALAPRAT